VGSPAENSPEAAADAAAMGRALVAAGLFDQAQPDLRAVDLVQSLHAEALAAIVHLGDCDCTDRAEAEAAVIRSLSRYGMTLGMVAQLASANIRAAQNAGVSFIGLDDALASPYLLPAMDPDECRPVDPRYAAPT
jgi:hypothetical protein